MKESVTSQSQDNYLNALNEFMNFAATNGDQPYEADHIYLYYLHRRQKASSLGHHSIPN